MITNSGMGKEELYILPVGVQTEAAIMEASMEEPQKNKSRTVVQLGNPTSGSTAKGF